MRPWHYARIKIGAVNPFTSVPFINGLGDVVTFWIHWRHNAKKSPFRNTYQAMRTIGLDGVE